LSACLLPTGRILASGNKVCDDRMLNMMIPHHGGTDGFVNLESGSNVSDTSTASGASGTSLPPPSLAVRSNSDTNLQSVSLTSLSSNSSVSVSMSSGSGSFNMGTGMGSGSAASKKIAGNRKKVSHSKSGSGSASQTPMAPFKASITFNKIIEAFNQSDLDSLSHLMRSCCHKNCELYTNTLNPSSSAKSSSYKNVIRGRRDVMIYWALQMETYPDGIWLCTKSTVKGNISLFYSVPSTRNY
jgi:hypothetical protein